MLHQEKEKINSDEEEVNQKQEESQNNLQFSDIATLLACVLRKWEELLSYKY